MSLLLDLFKLNCFIKGIDESEFLVILNYSCSWLVCLYFCEFRPLYKPLSQRGVLKCSIELCISLHYCTKCLD